MSLLEFLEFKFRLLNLFLPVYNLILRMSKFYVIVIRCGTFFLLSSCARQNNRQNITK